MNGAPLPPWDRLPAYTQPVETSYPVNTTSPIQIAKGDPMRVAIIFALGSGGAALVSTTFGVPIAFALSISITLPAITVSTIPGQSSANGILLPPTGVPLVLKAKEWGPLVTLPWYALASMAGSFFVTVITQSMLKWPETDGVKLLTPEVYNGAFGQMANGSAGRSRRCKLYGNRWGNRQTASTHGLPYFDDPGFCDNGDSGNA